MSNTTLAAIQAVIFDMDGLMLDTERMAQSAWQTAGAERQFDFPTQVYLQAVGRTKSDTEHLFKQAFGPEFPFDALYARKQEIFYAMLESEPIPTKPGLFALLDRIDQRKLAKAVATSTARALALKKLTSTGLISRFATIVGGDEVPNGRQARPGHFLGGCRPLGCRASALFGAGRFRSRCARRTCRRHAGDYGARSQAAIGGS